MSEKPYIIEGGKFEDNRGIMRFVNDLSLDEVKRFYTIKHPDVSVIRAWQGHKTETKYFYPLTGKFLIAWVKIDDFENPSEDLKAEYKILTAGKSEILIIPKGYANGFKALELNSEVLLFSDKSLEESQKDNVRFTSEKWLDWESFR